MVCFSDPKFFEALSRCSVCLSDSGCPQNDPCFKVKGQDEGVCTSCLSRSIDTGVSSCVNGNGAVDIPSQSVPEEDSSASSSSSRSTDQTSSSSERDAQEPVSSDVSASAEDSEVSPEESPEDDSGSVCFPGDSIVSLEDGSKKMMKDIRINDVLRTGPFTYSPVFSFTHRDSSVKYKFVEIKTKNGRNMQLTPSHYIYVNGTPSPAKIIKVGDKLIGEDGNTDVVLFTRLVYNKGLYNPQTLDGDIVIRQLTVTATARVFWTLR